MIKLVRKLNGAYYLSATAPFVSVLLQACARWFCLIKYLMHTRFFVLFWWEKRIIAPLNHIDNKHSVQMVPL